MTLRTLLVKLGFKGDVAKLTDFDNRITGLKRNIIGLGAIFASITAALGYFLNEAAKLEQTKIAFEVMTNSVRLGQKLIKDLFTFARTTPFRIPGVLQASKILLAMGVTAEEQIDTLTKIGHVAAGIGKPLDQLASIFGRVRAAGYLTGYEMERLRRAGVPLGAYLSELLKKPEKDILQMIRRKEISFEIFAEGWELMVEKRFPRLMDKLLLTFKGLVSNLQDYIYEIVAFSGEELLPVFKLMARQLMYLLESSRDLIGLKFKQFFGGVSSALFLLNKGFIKLYFRTRETITQFGGINRLFKIFATIFGTFVSIKSLTLLGKIGKIAFSILNVASIKLALIGAAMISIFLVTEDLLGFILGKKSAFQDFLDMLSVKAPTAYQHLIKWLRVLKREIEGLSLMAFGLWEGLTTGNWDMMKAGAEQVSEAWKMAFEKVGKAKVKGPSVEKYPIDYGELNIIEGIVAESPILRKMAEWTESMKNVVDEAFSPGGQTIEVDVMKYFREKKSGIEYLMEYYDKVKKDISQDIQLYKYIRERKLAAEATTPQEKILERGRKLRESGIISMPVSVNFSSLPQTANTDRIIDSIKPVLADTVNNRIDEIIRAGTSALESEQF